MYHCHIQSDRYRRRCCKIWKCKIVLVIYWRWQSHIYLVAPVCIRSLGSCYKLMGFTRGCPLPNLFQCWVTQAVSFRDHRQQRMCCIDSRKTSLKIFTAHTINYFSGYQSIKENSYSTYARYSSAFQVKSLALL